MFGNKRVEQLEERFRKLERRVCYLENELRVVHIDTTVHVAPLEQHRLQDGPWPYFLRDNVSIKDVVLALIDHLGLDVRYKKAQEGGCVILPIAKEKEKK